MAPHNYVILVCLNEDCGASFRVRRGDLLEKCPLCFNSGAWRVAMKDELTRSDRKLLKGLRILAE